MGNLKTYPYEKSIEPSLLYKNKGSSKKSINNIQTYQNMYLQHYNSFQCLKDWKEL